MLWQFIVNHQHADVAQLALQRDRYPMMSDSDFRYCLQQIDGRQRTRHKLPTFAAIDGWVYPPRLNLEQCSSERTARYKASLLSSFLLSPFTLIDGTGGYGVDTYFMSEVAAETHYFEQNAELAAIAEHNFRLAGKNIHCHPEPFSLLSLSASGLCSLSEAVSLLYLDPARRDSHGGKVFRLEDCTPDVTGIVRYVREHCPEMRVLLKLSPMLDFHQAVAQLGGTWEVHVVSVDGEVKELLLADVRCQKSEVSGQQSAIRRIHAVTLGDEQTDLCFTPDEESGAEVAFIPADQALESLFLYEPDAALLKAGAFRLISARYDLLKAAPNTHLYFSRSPLSAHRSPLPSRWWQVLGAYTRAKELQRVLTRVNVLTRNYVLPADALRKQLKLKDGGDDYIIGCRIADKPLLLHGRPL